MLVDLVFKNANILTKNGIINCGIAVENGKIFKICKSASLPNASKIVDVENKILLPGLIDAHTHLRDLEYSYKEDFYTGTSAAIVGGFTTIFDMPNTMPPTNSLSSLIDKIKVAKRKIVANVGFLSCFPPKIEEFKDIVKEGIIGFKIYFNEDLTELKINEDAVFLNAAKEVYKLGSILVYHPESQLVKIIENKFKKIGSSSLKDWYDSHPSKAEIESVEYAISIAKESRCRTHLCHISTNKALNIVKKAKSMGLPVTCEITPHHLLYSKKDIEKFGSFAIVKPPFRSENDVRKLFSSLVNGDIDLVASDHAPHSIEEKKNKNIFENKSGFPGLEITLPILLDMVNKNKLSFWRLLEILAEKPAKVFKIENKGFLKEGFDADFVIIDMKKEFCIDSSKFYSKAKYSLFDGKKVKGSPIKTFICGKLVASNNEIIAKQGSGNILRVH